MFDTSFRKNNVVEIVDYRMGSGKSTEILKWMDNNPQNNYIYVSPLLTEVDEGGRVHENLKNIVLEIPSDDKGRKSDSLLDMLKSGDSIACTHSLYLSMNESHFHELSLRNYIVIIDEEVNVIDGFDKYSQNDLRWLLEKEDISISDEDGMVEWIGSRDNIKLSHKYYDFLQYCDSKSLYSTKRSETMMVTQLPIKLFECARQVIVLTYMFDGNVLDCFLRLKGFDVQKFKGITCNTENKQSVRDLITLVPPNEKVAKYSLSATWWNDASGAQVKDVSNFIRNTAKNNNITRDEILWTVPKSRAVKGSRGNKNLVRPIGFSMDSEKNTCYLSSSTRATNIHYKKRAMVHCFNRRPLVPVSSYLQDYGFPVNFQVFATSEMVQWLWRGCIRDNKPMVIGIASGRMYNYFSEWLESDI